MSLRTLLTALLATAALGATAPPGQAATSTAVAVEGVVSFIPAMSAEPRTVELCFFAAPCGNTATPSGRATGVVVGADPTARIQVDGLRGSITYVEACGPTGFAATGSGSITVSAHDVATHGWLPATTGTWERTGTAVRISGDLVGLAAFVPTALSTCGLPVDVEVTGAVRAAG